MCLDGETAHVGFDKPNVFIRLITGLGETGDVAETEGGVGFGPLSWHPCRGETQHLAALLHWPRNSTSLLPRFQTGDSGPRAFPLTVSAFQPDPPTETGTLGTAAWAVACIFLCL